LALMLMHPRPSAETSSLPSLRFLMTLCPGYGFGLPAVLLVRGASEGVLDAPTAKAAIASEQLASKSRRLSEP
jgi:hypothetical protein